VVGSAAGSDKPKEAGKGRFTQRCYSLPLCPPPPPPFYCRGMYAPRRSACRSRARSSKRSRPASTAEPPSLSLCLCLCHTHILMTFFPLILLLFLPRSPIPSYTPTQGHIRARRCQRFPEGDERCEGYTRIPQRCTLPTPRRTGVRPRLSPISHDQVKVFLGLSHPPPPSPASDQPIPFPQRTSARVSPSSALRAPVHLRVCVPERGRDQKMN
jgi:hypothetical protein